MRPRPAVEVRRAALAVALLPRLVLPGPEVVELVDAADARDQRRALGSGRRANGTVVAQAARHPFQRGPFVRARREAHGRGFESRDARAARRGGFWPALEPGGAVCLFGSLAPGPPYSEGVRRRFLAVLIAKANYVSRGGFRIVSRGGATKSIVVAPWNRARV